MKLNMAEFIGSVMSLSQIPSSIRDRADTEEKRMVWIWRKDARYVYIHPAIIAKLTPDGYQEIINEAMRADDPTFLSDGEELYIDMDEAHKILLSSTEDAPKELQLQIQHFWMSFKADLLAATLEHMTSNEALSGIARKLNGKDDGTEHSVSILANKDSTSVDSAPWIDKPSTSEN